MLGMTSPMSLSPFVIMTQILSHTLQFHSKGSFSSPKPYLPLLSLHFSDTLSFTISVLLERVRSRSRSQPLRPPWLAAASSAFSPLFSEEILHGLVRCKLHLDQVLGGASLQLLPFASKMDYFIYLFTE